MYEKLSNRECIVKKPFCFIPLSSYFKNFKICWATSKIVNVWDTLHFASNRVCIKNYFVLVQFYENLPEVKFYFITLHIKPKLERCNCGLDLSAIVNLRFIQPIGFMSLLHTFLYE